MSSEHEETKVGEKAPRSRWFDRPLCYQGVKSEEIITGQQTDSSDVFTPPKEAS